MVTKNKQAMKWLKRIEANVDAMYAETISFEEFRAEQRRLWDSIGTGGLQRAVQKAIRQSETRS